VRLVEVAELGDDVGGRVAGCQQLRRRAGALDLPDRAPRQSGRGAEPAFALRRPGGGPAAYRRVVSGRTTPPSTSAAVGTVRNEVPTANSMPVKVAPSGTGAVPLRVSGPRGSPMRSAE
jgi:hypothetical protein